MLQGFIAIVASSIIAGLLPILQKQLVSDGLPILSMMLFNALTMEIMTFVISRIRRNSLKISRKQLLQAVLMGPAGTFVITAMLNYAYLTIPVGTAQMIHYFYPTVTCIIMGVIFQQKLTWLKAAAIGSSTAGLMLLAGKSGALAPEGLVLAFGSALLYGVFLVCNEKGTVNELPLEVKMFYTSLPSLILMAILAPATSNFQLPAGIKGWTMLLTGALIGALLCSFLLFYGIKKLGASTASFISILCPVVSLAASAVWFGEKITEIMVAGSALILASALLITLDGAGIALKRVRTSEAAAEA